MLPGIRKAEPRGHLPVLCATASGLSGLMTKDFEAISSAVGALPVRTVVV